MGVAIQNCRVITSGRAKALSSCKPFAGLFLVLGIAISGSLERRGGNISVDLSLLYYLIKQF